MLIRMRATGQVEDFHPAFAQRAIESGMAESLEQKAEKPGMPEKAAPETAAPETAAVAPPENAMLRRPLFQRIFG